MATFSVFAESDTVCSDATSGSIAGVSASFTSGGDSESTGASVVGSGGGGGGRFRLASSAAVRIRIR